MAILRANGFVLRIRRFGEADLIVTVFTEKWGKRTGIAKGARRYKSKLGGVFDLLNRVEVLFYEKSQLDLITQGALLEWFPKLKGDLSAVYAALSVAGTLDRLLPLHQPEPKAYALFREFLEALEGGYRAEQSGISAKLKLTSLLGYRPRFTACVRCGKKEGPFWFVAGQGGVLCADCAHGEGIKISRGLALSLDRLMRLPLERSGIVRLSADELRLAMELVDDYVKHLPLRP